MEEDLRKMKSDNDELRREAKRSKKQMKDCEKTRKVRIAGSRYKTRLI